MDTATPTYRDFHRPAFRDLRWLETSYFGFYVPELGLRAHMRAAFRVNLEVVHTLVAIYSRSGSVLDMDLWDSQIHVPLGANRYSDFRLDNGFAFKGVPAPNAYQVKFDSRCGRVSIDLEYEALMPPVELAFTRIGAAAPGFAAFLRQGAGDSPVGHLDQTFRVRGHLHMDGVNHQVDCVANRDHSWSPRAEFKSACGIFDNIHFGEDLTLFTMGAEPKLGEVEVTHAYVLRGRDLRTVKDIKARYQREGVITRALTYEVTDSAGEIYRIEADVLHAIEQDQGSNGYTVMNYLRPTWNGVQGYGESMWHWDIPRMQGIVRDMRATYGKELTVREAFDRWTAGLNQS